MTESILPFLPGRSVHFNKQERDQYKIRSGDLKKTELTIEGRTITIYPGPAGGPAAYLNCFEDEGERICSLLMGESMEAGGSPLLQGKNPAPVCSLITMKGANWEDDMTPWYCAPLAKGEPPCGGKADAWLQIITDKIIPAAEQQLEEKPQYRIIAGYSLAGLFALYSMYRTDIFARAGSMSGSLWFPDFLEYTRNHAMLRKPEKLYFSLGDRESRTRHPLMRTVQERTQAMYEDCRSAGIETVFELNKGNHFQHSDERTVKGIRWLLQE